MIKKHLTLLILLVTFSWDEFAHANDSKNITLKDEMIALSAPSSSAASPTTTHHESFADNGPLLSRQPNRIVQDWSSVCKQLCGAGLGGPICGPQCRILEQFQNNTDEAEVLFKSKQDLICKDLCSLNLGGSVCQCQQKMSLFPNNLTNRNYSNLSRICRIFCEHNEITIKGCNPCKIPNNYTNRNNYKKNMVDKIDKITTKLVEKITTTPTTTTITTTTTTKTPTTTTPRTTTTRTTKTTTTTKKPPLTTPNWDQICVELCKIGDGGALCNCDLPPLL